MWARSMPMPWPRSLEAQGLRASVVTLPPGEATKSYASLERVCDAVLAAKIERGDLVVALGGGVVGDLAGFAAAVVRRGVRFVQVPTTLLVPGRFLGRRQDRHQFAATARTSSAPSISRAWCWPTPRSSTRCPCARCAPAMRRWRSTASSTTHASSPGAKRNWQRHLRRRAGARRGRGAELPRQGRCGGARRARGRRPRAAQSRPHLRPRARADHGYDSARLVHGEGVAIGLALAFRFSACLGLCPAADAERVEAHLQAVGLPTRLGDVPGGCGTVDRACSTRWRRTRR